MAPLEPSFKTKAGALLGEPSCRLMACASSMFMISSSIKNKGVRRRSNLEDTDMMVPSVRWRRNDTNEDRRRRRDDTTRRHDDTVTIRGWLLT